MGIPQSETKTVSILLEEYEALRLSDYSNLKQEEAAKIMNVSRPTFTRIYNSCLKKLAKAFAEGRTILIEGGHVEFDKQWYRCLDCTSLFHESDENSECISCDSDNIEDINQSVKDWKEKQSTAVEKEEVIEYCICPGCEAQIPHQKGVPCFSLICPDCKTPLIRKDQN